MKMSSSKILVAAGLLMVTLGQMRAKESVAEKTLEAALTKAEAEKKLLFVQYGRESCGNCSALKGMIRNGQVRLSPSDFIYADLNCDDQAINQAFHTRFTVEGRTLPFVVIADPTGKQLAARAGYGSAAEFSDLIKEAKRSYSKAQKAEPAPRPTLVRPKPKSSDIEPDDNREARIWTAANGQKVTATLLHERKGVVMLKKEDGSPLQINRTSLSKADQEYLEGLRQAGAEDAQKTPDSKH